MLKPYTFSLLFELRQPIANLMYSMRGLRPVSDAEKNLLQAPKVALMYESRLMQTTFWHGYANSLYRTTLLPRYQNNLYQCFLDTHPPKTFENQIVFAVDLGADLNLSGNLPKRLAAFLTSLSSRCARIFLG